MAYHKFKPISFCNNWFRDQPVFNPIAVLFLSDTLNWGRNFITDQRGFLVFNRFRLMEYLPNRLSLNFENKIKAWVEGAVKQISN